MGANKHDGQHVWRFFRAGGFDQVRIDRGSDIANLKTLDQKLWAALACPTHGVEFDERTLALIDSDRDGRIRVPEVLDAIAWTTSILKDDRYLQEPGDGLPIDAISSDTERGQAIQSSAKLILEALGKADSGRISLQDSLDIERISAGTPFNGDGVITLESADSDEIKAALKDIMDCVGADTDRNHQPGVSQARADRFFAEAAAFAEWHKESVSARSALEPLGECMDLSASLLEEVRDKVDDYFARVSLVGVDARAADALNPQLATYETMSRTMLKTEDAAIASLPLARIEAKRPLPLNGSVNPAWSAKVGRLRAEVVTPLLGAKHDLAEPDWDSVKAKFSDYAAWMKRRPETALAGLGAERVKALLDPTVKQRIDALIARDKAVEPLVNAIADVEKLLRMKRDLMPLLNNFASFKDFYTRSGKAIFQAGTLYLDGRSCDLCVKVENEPRHAEFAALSQIYLTYCRCTRVGGSETMTIAAAFTAGDARYLRVGRNGIFYDRKGRDWDATVVRIVEHPISLRQAFWLPYRQFARFIGEQVQKVAAARAAAQQANMEKAALQAASGVSAPQPQTPQQQQQAFDVARFAGIFAAIGLAIGAIGTALVSIFTGFMNLAWWQMPLVLVALVLLISGPSCIIAWFKLQGRNLGPVLDACGWAVNTQLKINLPFGRSLTSMAALPDRAERSLTDPYAEKRTVWPYYLLVVVGLAALYVSWRYGVLQQWLDLK